MTIPAKLQSYMACGCPIIASVRGETKQIIEESGCGVISEIGSAQSLANEILLFMQMDETSKLAMSQKAIQYCKDNFNKEHLVQIMEDFCLKSMETAKRLDGNGSKSFEKFLADDSKKFSGKES